MDLALMRLLVRVADLRNISAAARQLGLSPSAATRRLAALEKSSGARLMLRTTRHLEMTEAGARLAQWAWESLIGYDDVLERLGELKGRPAGLVRFACPEQIAPNLLAEMLAEFAIAYPDIEVATTITSRNVQLIHENFDTAIEIGVEAHPELIARKIFDVDQVVCAAPAYIDRHGSPESPCALGEHAVLTHSVLDAGEWLFEREGTVLPLSLRPRTRVDSMVLLHELALRGAGIARLTRRSCSTDLRDGRLIQVMPQWRAVASESGSLSAWVVVPHRQILLRTRAFVDALVAFMRVQN